MIHYEAQHCSLHLWPSFVIDMNGFDCLIHYHKTTHLAKTALNCLISMLCADWQWKEDGPVSTSFMYLSACAEICCMFSWPYFESPLPHRLIILT